MVDMVILSSLLVVLMSMLLLFMIKRRKKTRYLSLPGPSGVPILGCFFDIDKQNMHITLDTWAYKYGEMFQFVVFGKYMWVINSAKIARELYLQEPMATLSSGRAPSFCGKYLMDNEDIILCPYNTEWSYRRKTAHRLLRAYGEGLHEIENQLSFTLDKIKGNMKKAENRHVNPSDYIDEFLLENLEVMVTGQRGNKALQQYMFEMDHTFNVLTTPGVDRILTNFPVIRHIPCLWSDTFKRCLSARNRMMDIFKRVLTNNPKSTGMYKDLIEKVKEDEKKERKKITMKSATCILHDLISAGYMTTRGSLSSIFKLLLSKPDVQTKLQKEIDEVIGKGRSPQIADRGNCNYTEAVILESLRYVSHTPLTPHCITEEFEFRGIKIPKHCMTDMSNQEGVGFRTINTEAIFVNAWHIHHSAKEWEEPFQFKPERFLDEHGILLPATHPNRKRLLTFGLGKRSCIGEVFARSRIFLFLATVMQLYTVCPPTDEEIPLFHPTEMKPGIVLLPEDYTCKFIPR